MNRKAAADRPPIWTLAPGGARLPAPTRFAGGRRIPTAWNRTGRNPALQMPRIDLLRSMPRQRRDENLRRNPRNPRRRDRRRGRLSLSHGAGIPGIPAARPAGGYPLPRKTSRRRPPVRRSSLRPRRRTPADRSPFDEEVCRTTKANAQRRNDFVAALAAAGNRSSRSTRTKTGTCATAALARFKSRRSADAFPNERRRSPHFATSGEYMPCRGFRVADNAEMMGAMGKPDRAYPCGLAERDANSGASRASLRACPWHPSIEL
jgi:hypothetical protein